MCQHKYTLNVMYYTIILKKIGEERGGGGEEGDLLDLQSLTTCNNACCYIHICTFTLCIYKHASWSSWSVAEELILT